MRDNFEAEPDGGSVRTATGFDAFAPLLRVQNMFLTGPERGCGPRWSGALQVGMFGDAPFDNAGEGIGEAGSIEQGDGRLTAACAGFA